MIYRLTVENRQVGVAPTEVQRLSRRTVTTAIGRAKRVRYTKRTGELQGFETIVQATETLPKEQDVLPPPTTGDYLFYERGSNSYFPVPAQTPVKVGNPETIRPILEPTRTERRFMRGVILLVALLGCSCAQERFDAPYGVPQRVKVSEAKSERLLVRRIEPTYPQAAQQKCLQGNVVLSVIVAKDGYVKSRASDQRTCRIARRCRKGSNRVEI